MNAGHFQPGETGNPNGRPPGAANRRSEELRRRLRDRGDIDPADFCSALVSNQNEPKELRLAAANYLLPYLYPKRGAITEPYRDFIEHPITLPHPEPQTIQQSNANILYISNLKSSGQTDQAWGDNLIADQCRVRDGLVDDAKLISGQEGRDQHITISGGMPVMPGLENVVMPRLNGHNGHVLEHQQTPMTVPAQGPEPKDPGP